MSIITQLFSECHHYTVTHPTVVCMSSTQGMEEGSVVILQLCAHNPTGMDPTLDQWHDIIAAVKVNNVLL